MDPAHCDQDFDENSGEFKYAPLTAGRCKEAIGLGFFLQQQRNVVYGDQH